MSTMHSRSASLLSSFESEEVRLSNASSRGAYGLENTSSAGTHELNAVAQIGQSGTQFEPEAAGAIRSEAPNRIELPPRTLPHHPRSIAPIPRITIHAFCENESVLSIIDQAARDRLMSRAKVEIFAGGIKAAIEYYGYNPAPSLIIVERRAPNNVVLSELEELAQFCDPGTKVLILGYSNDIGYYRELLQRGVSEYIVAPIGSVDLVAAISAIYRDASSGKLGQVYAFVGAKGGVGSSTIAHNIGWTIAQSFDTDVVLAGLDLPFGTAGLNFNVDTHQGVVEAIQDANRLDDVLLDRLLTKCDDHFSLLTAPGTLDASHELGPDAFSGLLEIARCRRELCRNSEGAISGMKMVLDQAARSIVSFAADACVSVFQPSTLRMVI